jgi:PIN like domain
MASVYGERVAQELDDERWLADAGRHDWAVLIKDDAIRRRRAERDALAEAEVHAFCLTNAQLRTAEQSARFVGNIARIQRQSESPAPIDSTPIAPRDPTLVGSCRASSWNFQEPRLQGPTSRSRCLRSRHLAHKLSTNFGPNCAPVHVLLRRFQATCGVIGCIADTDPQRQNLPASKPNQHYTEGGRFELPVRQSDAQRFSRPPHSTTLPPLQGDCVYCIMLSLTRGRERG